MLMNMAKPTSVEPEILRRLATNHLRNFIGIRLQKLRTRVIIGDRKFQIRTSVGKPFQMKSDDRSMGSLINHGNSKPDWCTSLEVEYCQAWAKFAFLPHEPYFRNVCLPGCRLLISN